MSARSSSLAGAGRIRPRRDRSVPSYLFRVCSYNKMKIEERKDRLYTESQKRLSHLGGCLLPGQLLLHGPVIVVTTEDPMAIHVHSQGNAVLEHDLFEAGQIALSILLACKHAAHQLPRGIIDGHHQTPLPKLLSKPAVRTPVP